MKNVCVNIGFLSPSKSMATGFLFLYIYNNGTDICFLFFPRRRHFVFVFKFLSRLSLLFSTSFTYTITQLHHRDPASSSHELCVIFFLLLLSKHLRESPGSPGGGGKERIALDFQKSMAHARRIFG